MKPDQNKKAKKTKNNYIYLVRHTRNSLKLKTFSYRRSDK